MASSVTALMASFFPSSSSSSTVAASSSSTSLPDRLAVSFRYPSSNSPFPCSKLSPWKPVASTSTVFLSGSPGTEAFLRLFKGTDPNVAIIRPKMTARLFGPSIFEASKLKVLFLGTDEEKHPDQLPRAYTLTHSDITAKLTLAVSQNINKAQIEGWYSRLQRDEVLAEWKKAQGTMSLHVHCHISGGHWLLDAIAKLRFYIFRKELPVVLEAFRHGDQVLLNKHPELERALVWVYFHSNVKEFNRVECWGPLADAAKGSERSKLAIHNAMDEIMQEGRALAAADDKKWKHPVRCPNPCDCCFPPRNIIPLPDSFKDPDNNLQRQA